VLLTRLGDCLSLLEVGPDARQLAASGGLGLRLAGGGLCPGLAGGCPLAGRLSSARFLEPSADPHPSPLAFAGRLLLGSRGKQI
jgi:hypothetical protein